MVVMYIRRYPRSVVANFSVHLREQDRNTQYEDGSECFVGGMHTMVDARRLLLLPCKVT